MEGIFLNGCCIVALLDVPLSCFHIINSNFFCKWTLKTIVTLQGVADHLGDYMYAAESI